MPAYASQPVPGAWQAAPTAKPAPRMPVNAALATASPSAAPRPTIRLQAADTLLKPAPTPLLLPSPESLGVRPLSAGEVVPQALDWNNVHARLGRLGALGFHMDRLSEGGVRVTFMLPDANNQRARQIEVVADSEAAAVNAALEHAEMSGLTRK
jgi:hypothetical protein